MRVDNPDIPVHVGLEIVWEPLSYRIEGGAFGNEEHDYSLRLTKGNGLSGSEADGNGPGSAYEREMLERVRLGGFPAIPGDVLVRVPKSNNTRRPWERWAKRAQSAGLRLDIAEDGNPTSPDVGQIFEVVSGFDDFPVWDETKGNRGGWTNPDKGEEGSAKYMRYPVAKAPDYVAPEDVPVVVRETREDAAAPTTTGTANTGPSAEALAGAVQALGLVGQPVEALSGSQILARANAKIGEAPVLASSEVSQALTSGNFAEYLVGKGVIGIEDGKVALA